MFAETAAFILLVVATIVGLAFWAISVINRSTP